MPLETGESKAASERNDAKPSFKELEQREIEEYAKFKKIRDEYLKKGSTVSHAEFAAAKKKYDAALEAVKGASHKDSAEKLQTLCDSVENMAGRMDAYHDRYGRSDAGLGWTGVVKLLTEAKGKMAPEKWTRLRNEAFKDRSDEEVLARVVKELRKATDL